MSGAPDQARVVPAAAPPAPTAADRFAAAVTAGMLAFLLTAFALC